MAAFLYSLTNPRLKDEFPRLQPIPGYCIFVDLVDSVALKDQGKEMWCQAIRSVIVHAPEWLGVVNPEETSEKQSVFPPLKVMGDGVMFFVPQSSMASDASALSIFHSLHSIIEDSVYVVEKRYHKREVRVAAVFCEKDAYEITFVEGVNDVYGKDIDLAARLLKKANPQELVMNEAFFLKAKNLFERSNKPEHREFGKVVGPWPENLKGFQEPELLYKWCGPRFRKGSLSFCGT